MAPVLAQVPEPRVQRLAGPLLVVVLLVVGPQHPHQRCHLHRQAPPKLALHKLSPSSRRRG